VSKRIKTPTIIEAIKHKSLFGSLPAFQSLDSWAGWVVWLKTVFALPMDDSELDIYRQCTGRENPPSVAPSEVYTIVGRRGGKSFISALTAVYVGCFGSYKRYLNAGERAVVLVLARDRDQAKIVFNYVAGLLRAIPPLHQMIEVERADEIELNNGVTVMVKTSDYRAIRGLTVAACIADEIAFWDSGGISPDREVLVALRPAMSTIPSSKLLIISTPYSQSGTLYESHREHFGKDDNHVLVWVAETRVMNPTISEDMIQRELERDPEAAKAEWLAGFRDDLESAFSFEAIQACVIPGRDELPSSPVIPYRAFVDPSGGRHDSFTLAISHKEKDTAVIDLIRAWAPPFDPSVVVAEASEIVKAYGIASVIGDNYAGEWPVESFRNCGIAYERSEKNKSELYLQLVPTVNGKQIQLLDHRKLIEELRRLERRRGRSEKDSFDHPPRLSDDVANAVAGVAWLVLNDEDSAATTGFNARYHLAKQPLLPVFGESVYIGTTLVSPWASVLAQNVQGGVQILGAFVTETGGLRYHLQQQVIPWLIKYAGWALRNKQSMCATYSGDNMTLLEVQTVYASLETILRADWQQPTQVWEGRRDAMAALLGSVEHFTFRPRFQVNPEATLIAQALSRSPDLNTVHGSIQNALSLVVDRIQPDAPLMPKTVKVITASGPIMHGPR